MGLEKLWQKSRKDRIIDPDVQRALAEEVDRVKKSLEKLGGQTKSTCAGILFNTFLRPLFPTAKDKKKKLNMGQRVVHGAVDSTEEVLKLVARILMSTGRVAKYGIRCGLAI